MIERVRSTAAPGALETRAVLARLLTSPRTYAVWALLVAGALGVTYFAHPYVFGFTALGLAWLTGAVALAGGLVAVRGRELRRRQRLAIVGWIACAGGALVVAFAVLRTFHWG